MPLSDVLLAALSRPAGRVVDGPVRGIVSEVLQDHGYASPAEVAALQDELQALRRSVQQLAKRVQALEGEAAELRARAEGGEAPEEALPDVDAAEVMPLDAVVPQEGAPDTVVPQEGAPDARSPEAAAAAAAPEAASTPAFEPAAAGPCCVCDAPAARGPFCGDHHRAWFAGTLSGFVGPEGLVAVDGKPFRVASDHAGCAYTLTGTKARRVRVQLADGSRLIVKKTEL